MSLITFVLQGTTEEFSVFVYDTQKQGDSWVQLFLSHEYYVKIFAIFISQLNAAKASMKRLKTMRHPNILTYVDGLEVRTRVPLIV